jgi:hypothetical protein
MIVMLWINFKVGKAKIESHTSDSNGKDPDQQFFLQPTIFRSTEKIVAHCAVNSRFWRVAEVVFQNYYVYSYE